MPRPESLELTHRVLPLIAENSLDVADHVHVEPRAAFVDPRRWADDLAMLRRSPHVIAWEGEVSEPGSFTTKDVLGTPVIITRARDGRVRAFVNGCAHRGAQVAEGCGTARALSCPYHGWSYRLDGTLKGVPGREMFADAGLDGLGLTPLPVCVRAGLIVVGLSATVDLDTALADVVGPLADYCFERNHHVETRRFVLEANWKLAVDVNFEGYHFPYVHADTLDPIATNNSVTDVFGQDIRWAFPFRDIVQYGVMTEDEWPDQFFGTVVYGLFPSCVLIEAPASSQMLRVYPGEHPGQSIVYLTYGSREPVTTDEARDFYRMAMDAAVRVLADQDFPAAEACQRGLQGGVPRVIFGRNEPLLQHLSREWENALTPRTVSSRSTDQAGADTTTVDASA